MISTLPAVIVFLGLLFLATQLLVGLYAASVVTATAFDAARLVAGTDGGPGAEARAEGHARALLGGAAGASFAWSYPDTDGRPGPDAVALRVRAASPVRLLPAVRLPFDTVDRTVTIRLEGVR